MSHKRFCTSNSIPNQTISIAWLYQNKRGGKRKERERERQNHTQTYHICICSISRGSEWRKEEYVTLCKHDVNHHHHLALIIYCQLRLLTRDAKNITRPKQECRIHELHAMNKTSKFMQAAKGNHYYCPLTGMRRWVFLLASWIPPGLCSDRETKRINIEPSAGSGSTWSMFDDCNLVKL